MYVANHSYGLDEDALFLLLSSFVIEDLAYFIFDKVKTDKHVRHFLLVVHNH